MRNTMSYETDSLVYPGVYMPLHKDEEVKEELRHFNERDIIMAAVNVIELADAFKVEIVIPGVKREDFLIHAYGNIVSVSVLQKEKQLNNEKEKKPLREYKYYCFDKQIILPPHADTEFICAEYLAGILRLYIPKLSKPANSRHTRVAVY